MVQLGRRDSLRIPRTEKIFVDTPSRDRPVITEFASGPERRILFDYNDDETYGNEATKAQIVNSPYRIETREVHSEEPRSVSTSVPVRPTSSIGTSVSSSEPPRIPVMGILEYGGGIATPHRPGTVNVVTNTTHQRVASGGGDGGDDSSSSHSHRTGEGPTGGGRGPPRGGGGGGPPTNGNGDGEESDVSSISSHRGPLGPQGVQGPLVHKDSRDLEDYKVIEVCRDPLDDRVYKVYVVYLVQEDH